MLIHHEALPVVPFGRHLERWRRMPAVLMVCSEREVDEEHILLVQQTFKWCLPVANRAITTLAEADEVDRRTISSPYIERTPYTCDFHGYHVATRCAFWPSYVHTHTVVHPVVYTALFYFVILAM